MDVGLNLPARNGTSGTGAFLPGVYDFSYSVAELAKVKAALDTKEKETAEQIALLEQKAAAAEAEGLVVEERANRATSRADALEMAVAMAETAAEEATAKAEAEAEEKAKVAEAEAEAKVEAEAEAAAAAERAEQRKSSMEILENPMAGVLKIKAEKAMTEELFTEEEREEMMKKDGDFATRLNREEVSCLRG